ncbi:Hypothetical protein IALB_1209 [Ignavibacterium album JCM 16511]|uniref:TPR repeat protein n=1 Tax=Ignavibacterium album (strain DSM 19864 / JCM 16511 / NBRC 101810 / Mat9-16) TaxID=945713 RepID=I0AIW3_IGNAJ|nr:hypothetical protein [Ignavibacterium album]AFH48920.1 Hypothetical protein IALB_1209 [Ignavibacterium album JCM 16511]
MLFIISTSFDNIKNDGSFFWGENYFPQIRNYIPLNTTDVISITEGIIFFNKASQKEKCALKIKINQTHITRVYLKIFYTVTEQLNYKSYQIRNAIKQYFQKNSVLELPFCSAVENEKFYLLLEDGKLFSELSFYEEKNNWEEIYKILESYMPVEKSVLWNKPEALNRFSFATAKLSECTENLKRKFPDNEKRKEFIKQKKYFRELTLKLRVRCIELNPDNPAYYSNLAYTYYQSVNELNTPNGRRDGNLIRDAEKAIEYFDKALILDNNRIPDIYRKAMLLSEILPTHTLYKSDLNDSVNEESQIKEKYLSAVEMIQRGIEEFIKLTKIYENLSEKAVDNSLVPELKNHYKKYYTKALYHIAQKKLKLTKINFNLFNILYGYKPIQCEPDKLNSKVANLNIANSYIEKCIEADYTKKKEEKYLIDLVECDNFIAGVYKAYLKALIETYLFVLTEKTKHLINAKDYFHKALEMNFPLNQKNQNKMFIIEKLAVLNLIERKYEAAIKLLEPIYKKSIQKNSGRFPLYAAFTLSIAYAVIGDKQRATQIIEEHLNCGNKIFEHKFLKLKEHLDNKVQFIKSKEKNE